MYRVMFIIISNQLLFPFLTILAAFIGTFCLNYQNGP